MAVDLYLSVDKSLTDPSGKFSPFPVATDTATQGRILDFSLGVTTATATGAGAGPSKPSVSALNFSLSDFNTMSTGLLQSALNGTSHTYYLYVVKSSAGDAPKQPVETYTFKNGFVSGFSEASGDDSPTDSVSIAFRSMTRSLASQAPNGQMSSTPATVSYDSQTNRVSAARVLPPADAPATDDAPAPTDESFTFKTGSAQNIAHVLRSQRGQAALHEIAGDFHSLAAVLAASHPSSDGSGTVITLPDQNTITLSGLSEKQIRADAAQFRHLLFG